MQSSKSINSDRFIQFIGTGNAFTEGGRFNAAYWLTSSEISKKYTLIDCGPTTLAGIKKFNLPFEFLTRIILTHYHGDHITGIPFLLLDRAYLTPFDSSLNREKFDIIGPPGLEERITRLVSATYPSQLETLLKLCNFIVIEPGSSKIIDDFSLTSYKANHPEEATMYKFTFSGRKSFVYTGDNEMISEQLSFFKDCEFLITECTTYESQNGNHTSYIFIEKNLENFKDLNVNKIYLSHIGSEVYNRIENNIKDIIITAYDGMIVPL